MIKIRMLLVVSFIILIANTVNAVHNSTLTHEDSGARQTYPTTNYNNNIEIQQSGVVSNRGEGFFAFNLGIGNIQNATLTLNSPGSASCDHTHVPNNLNYFHFFYCDDYNFFDESTITWNSRNTDVVNCTYMFNTFCGNWSSGYETWDISNITSIDNDGRFVIKISTNSTSGGEFWVIPKPRSVTAGYVNWTKGTYIPPPIENDIDLYFKNDTSSFKNIFDFGENYKSYINYSISGTEIDDSTCDLIVENGIVTSEVEPKLSICLNCSNISISYNFTIHDTDNLLENSPHIYGCHNFTPFQITTTVGSNTTVFSSSVLPICPDKSILFFSDTSTILYDSVNVQVSYGGSGSNKLFIDTLEFDSIYSEHYNYFGDDIYYNSTSKFYELDHLHESYTPGNFTITAICNATTFNQSLFDYWDNIENETYGVNNISQWTDRGGSGTFEAITSPLHSGNYSMNTSLDYRQLQFKYDNGTNFNPLGTHTLQFEGYKATNSQLDFSLSYDFYQVYWHPNGSVYAIGCPKGANLTPVSAGEWHTFQIIQNNATYHNIYVDGVWKTCGYSTGSNLLYNFRYRGTVSGAVLDNIRLGRNEYYPITLSTGGDNYSEQITINNELPVSSVIGINNSNGFFIFNISLVLEYNVENWQFYYSAIDNNKDTVIVRISNNSHILEEYENPQFEINVSGFTFTETSGNPYNFSVFINDTFGEYSYSEFMFNVTDSIFPVCTGLDDENVSTANDTYNWTVNCFDENFYSFNITCDNTFNYSEIGLNNLSFSWDNSTSVDTKTECDFKYCDGHTKNKLSKDFFVVAEKEKLKIKNNGKNVNLTITSQFESFTYQKEEDRIKFKIKHKDKTGLLIYSLLYRTSKKSNYLKDDKYKGWIVDYESQTWFDANIENDKNAIVEVNQIDYDLYEITIYSYESELMFESIGELNCISGTQVLDVEPVPPPPDTGVFGAGMGTTAGEFNLMEVIMIGIVMILLMFMMVVGLWKRIAGVVLITSVIFAFVGIFIQWLALPMFINIIGVGMIFWSAMMIAVSFGIANR